jgi:hypothetical protein
VIRSIDFNRVRNEEELAELTPEERRLYDEAQTRIVFGHDYKNRIRPDGSIQENGIGSELNQSIHHRIALQKEQERINRLKAEARLAATAPATGLPADPAALQEQIDELKAQLAALGVAPATASPP